MGYLNWTPTTDRYEVTICWFDSRPDHRGRYEKHIVVATSKFDAEWKLKDRVTSEPDDWAGYYWQGLEDFEIVKIVKENN